MVLWLQPGFLNPATFAQELPFIRISSEQGLSQGMIYCMIQDHSGFIWVGTKNGLNRYDGYSFRVFLHMPFDTLSLMDNRILQVMEDKSNRIWIITELGLDLFDPQKEIFHHIRLWPAGGKTSEYGDIAGMIEDDAGAIWLSTVKHGLIRLWLPEKSYDLSKLETYSLQSHRGTDRSFREIMLVNNIIQLSDSIYLTRSENEYFVLTFDHKRKKAHLTSDLAALPTWMNEAISTPGPLKILKSNLGSIWVFNASGAIQWKEGKGEPPRYHNLKDRIPGWCPYLVWWFSEGQHGELMLSGQTGFILYNTTTDRLQALDQSSLPIKGYGMGHALLDKGGELWIGTRGGGLFKTDLTSGRFAKSRTPEDAVLVWNGISVRSLMQSLDGEIFIGSSNFGLTVLDPLAGKTYNVNTDSKETSCIYEDQFGAVWAGAGDLFKYKKQPAGQWELIEKFNIPKDNYPHGVKIAGWSDSVLWIATIENICRFDITKNTFSCTDLPFTYIPSQSFYDFPAIKIEHDESIWIGTGAGLFQFNPKTKVFQSYRNIPSDPKSLSMNIVRSIEIDPLEPERYLWIGTAGAGLDRLDRSTGKFEHFGMNEGLPDVVIYGIIADQAGNLWISTNHGLSVLNIRSLTFRNFDMRDGMQDSEFNAAAYSVTQDGIMLFGGINGFNRFRPEDIMLTNTYKPQLVFTDLKISNKKILVRQEDFPYTESITYAEKLTIPFHVKSFTIEFAALDFTEPLKNQYAYRLEGFESEWQYNGTNRNATFTNLDPGKYIFHVKASNNDGIWNEEGISLQIVILPPWYRTWWAYILYLLALFGIFTFLRQREIKERELKHQLELEQVVAKNLKEMDQVKGRFFANISHEFRTPLTLILGQLENINQKVSDNAIRKMANMATKNGRQLLELITQMLDLTKLESGRMELNKNPQDITSFVGSAVSAFQILAEEQGVGLQFESKQNSLIISFDREKMEKVIYNLLSNALKFTPRGGNVFVTIETTNSKEPSDQYHESVCIAVRDTGIGIPADKVQAVFDRFYQVDSLASRVRGGTGIGLALVKELVQLHGGEVTISSTLGEGTIFMVRLPVNMSDLSQGTVDKFKLEQVPETIPVSIQSVATSASNHHNEETQLKADQEVSASMPMILVTEDNPDMRRFIVEQLSDAGYATREAENGLQGIELAKEIMPDLIITDVMMPGMDGLTFTKHLRAGALTSHIPVIMLTSKAGQEDKIEGLETGVDDYLTKPFSTRELLVRVANLIQLRKLLRERFSKVGSIAPSEVSVIPMDQVFLDTVIKAIEVNLGESGFGVDQLSELAHMSTTHLHRKLTALIDQSPGQLIRSMRLQRAADLLAKQAGNVNEIAYQVGFSVPENFSKSFKKQFGVTPSQYASEHQITGSRQ